MGDQSTASTSLAAEAFGVFVDYVASQVAVQNASLEERNAGMRPIKDHLNRVEVRVDGEVVAECRLADATEEKCGCDHGKSEVLALVVGEGARPVPLSRIVARDCDVELAVAGRAMDEFDLQHSPFPLAGCVYEKSPRLVCCARMISSSGHSLYGTLGNLTDEDEELLSVHDVMSSFELPEQGLSPGVMFTPGYINLRNRQDLNGLRKKIVGSVDESIQATSDPARDLRYEVFVASGNDRYKKLEDDNLVLSMENCHLSKLRDLVKGVEFTHGEGCLHVDLIWGQRSDDSWVLNFWDQPDELVREPSLGLEGLLTMKCSLSGVMFGGVPSFFTFVTPNNERAVAFTFGDVTLTGTIADHGKEEEEFAADLLSEDFERELERAMTDPSDGPKFPTLTVWFDCVFLKLSSVRNSLELLGIDVEEEGSEVGGNTAYDEDTSLNDDIDRLHI